MTVRVARSQNASLNEGVTDGTYKKFINDRDGVTDEINVRSKSMIAPQVYGLVGEAQTKIRGDGKVVRTPNTR